MTQMRRGFCGFFGGCRKDAKNAKIYTAPGNIAMLLPFLAAGARRLHDIGKGAWWLLFLPVPVGGIITLGILWAMPVVDELSDDTLPAR